MPNPRKWLRRVRRLVLRSLVLALVALLAVNVLLNLPPVKGKAEGVLAGRFGAPVEIGRVTYLPPTALRARAVTMGNPESPAATMDVAARFHAWQTLTGWGESRALVFSDIRCQNAEIALALPRPDPEASVAVQSPKPTAPAASPAIVPLGGQEEEIPDESVLERASEPDVAADEVVVAPPASGEKPAADPLPPAAPAKPPLSISYRSIVLEGGRIEIEDAESGRVVGTVESLRVNVTPSADERVVLAGEVEIGEVRMLDQLVAETGSAGLRVTRQGIDVADIVLPTAGGPITGRAIVGAGVDRPFKLALGGSGLDVAALLAGVGRGEAWVTAGLAELRLRMSGSVSRPGAARARLRVTADGLEMGGVPGDGRAMAVIDLVGGNVLLSDARAELDGRLVRSVGRVRRDGVLLANTRIYTPGDHHLGFARRAAAMRPDAGPLSFAALEGTDWHYLDILVAGGLRDPRTDLWGDGKWSPVPELLSALFRADPVRPTSPGELAPVSAH